MLKRPIFLVLGVLALSAFYFIPEETQPVDHDRILEHIVDPAVDDLRLFLKDDTGAVYHNFGKLRTALLADSLELIFGMNAGMFMEDHRALGLYIEDGVQYRKLNTTETAYGNFYLQPNGVFYWSNTGRAIVTTSKLFTQTENIKYATQSGPMLLIEGAIHPNFNEGSPNLHIRNGVGILPDGRILFAVSKVPINFFDFATFFKTRGCKNALYLDGGVCRTYLPEKNWKQLDGILGPLIGVVKRL